MFAIRLSFLIAVPLLALVAGLFLIVKSRRANARHLCRACGYDLHGLPITSCCPECGTDLDRSTTFVPGQIITRRWQLVAGVLLAFTGGLALECVLFIVLMALMVHGVG